MKQNKIALVAVCEDTKNNCVYFVPNSASSNICKYNNNGFCRSDVARVNAMTTRPKEMGL